MMAWPEVLRREFPLADDRIPTAPWWSWSEIGSAITFRRVDGHVVAVDPKVLERIVEEELSADVDRASPADLATLASGGLPIEMVRDAMPGLVRVQNRVIAEAEEGLHEMDREHPISRPAPGVGQTWAVIQDDKVVWSFTIIDRSYDIFTCGLKLRTREDIEALLRKGTAFLISDTCRPIAPWAPAAPEGE